MWLCFCVVKTGGGLVSNVCLRWDAFHGRNEEYEDRQPDVSFQVDARNLVESVNEVLFVAGLGKPSASMESKILKRKLVYLMLLDKFVLLH